MRAAVPGTSSSVRTELLASVEFHGAFVLKEAGADAGALRVEDDADGKVELFAHLLQVIDMGAMLFVRSVREIEARKTMPATIMA